MLKITDVKKGGVGEEAGLKSGDIILNFDGGVNADILDYIYYDSSESFTLNIDRKGKSLLLKIEKYPEESMGLEFDDSAQLKPKRCNNKCIFCFVDQLPKGMRKTLYVKDDDYRLSLVTGNYITLTNITKNDEKRVIEKRFSPLYISVHAVDSNVRQYMLGNKNAGKITDILEKFAGAGIIMHCQVVLCPEINDGKVLDNTLQYLYSLQPNVKSVAVVPVGLTAHRCNLPVIRAVTASDAKKAIKQCSRYRGFAYCSDEMYIKADINLPPVEYYGEYEQIENGVGLIRKFEHEFLTAMEEYVKPKQRDVAVITGISAYPFISGLVTLYSCKYGFKTEVISIKNNFFGNSVTVSGLVCGKDIIEQAKDSLKGKEVILPRSMLREFENVFLDGIDLIDLERRLKADIKVCGVSGYGFFDALTGEL